MTDTKVAVREMSFAEALNDALDLALAKDDRVFILGEDIADPSGGVLKATKGLSTKYGRNRVRNTPISEQAIVGAAIGAGLAGMRPICEVMLMDFFAVCMDQVANHAAKLRYMSGGRTGVPITIRTTVTGGRSFAAQHSQSLEAWLMHTPGLKIAVPGTPRDAKGLLTSCIEDEDPCIHVESMTLLFGSKQEVPEGHFAIPLGQAEVKREGSDVTVVTYGRMLPEVVTAADQLAEEGVNVEIVDLRTLVPLDMQTVLESVAKTKRAVIVHASTAFAGSGAEIAARISAELFGTLEAPVERCACGYAPVPFAPELETRFYPNAERIAAAVRSTVSR